MTMDPHIREFVENSNALSGIFLNDSVYKPRNVVGNTWDDEEFIHHYDVLCWVIASARQGIVPTAIEVNKMLMERFLDAERVKSAGRLRRSTEHHYDRITVPPSEVYEMYKRWEAASQRYQYLNTNFAKTEYIGCSYCQSIWMHKAFMYVRPFEDGNGRTGRLMFAAHRIVSGNYTLLPIAGKELPLVASMKEEYENVLIEFTRHASLIKVEHCLDNMFRGKIIEGCEGLNCTDHTTCLEFHGPSFPGCDMDSIRDRNPDLDRALDDHIGKIDISEHYD